MEVPRFPPVTNGLGAPAASDSFAEGDDGLDDVAAGGVGQKPGQGETNPCSFSLATTWSRLWMQASSCKFQSRFAVGSWIRLAPPGQRRSVLRRFPALQSLLDQDGVTPSAGARPEGHMRNSLAVAYAPKTGLAMQGQAGDVFGKYGGLDRPISQAPCPLSQTFQEGVPDSLACDRSIHINGMLNDVPVGLPGGGRAG